MPAADIAILPPAATSGRLGGLKLAGEVFDPASTADAPNTAIGGRSPVHSHRRLMVPIRPMDYTNNMGGVFDLYPANNNGSNASSGHYIIVLNASTTFTLRTDSTQDSEAYGTAPRISRQPGVLTENGQGFYTPQGQDYAAEVWVTFVQDNTGGWTPTVQGRQSSMSLGASPGSGTAGQALTAGYKYLGPLVGWVRFYSSGWVTFPYTLAASSSRGGQYLRALVGTGGSGITETVLDNVAKSPLSFRKALYDRGMVIQITNGVTASPLAVGNQLATSGQVAGNGLSDLTLPFHMTATIPLVSDPVSSALHEVGHIADFLLASGSAASGALVGDDTALNALWVAEKAAWMAAGGTDNMAGDSQTNVGWGGSRGYFVRTRSEWIAQVIGAWAYRKWAVATANTSAQAVAETNFLLASNSTNRTALLAALDAKLAAYAT